MEINEEFSSRIPVRAVRSLVTAHRYRIPFGKRSGQSSAHITGFQRNSVSSWKSVISGDITGTLRIRVGIRAPVIADDEREQASRSSAGSTADLLHSFAVVSSPLRRRWETRSDRTATSFECAGAPTDDPLIRRSVSRISDIGLLSDPVAMISRRYSLRPRTGLHSISTRRGTSHQTLRPSVSRVVHEDTP